MGTVLVIAVVIAAAVGAYYTVNEVLDRIYAF
jgi:hypothetical protein